MTATESQYHVWLTTAATVGRPQLPIVFAPKTLVCIAFLFPLPVRSSCGHAPSGHSGRANGHPLFSPGNRSTTDALGLSPMVIYGRPHKSPSSLCQQCFSLVVILWPPPLHNRWVTVATPWSSRKHSNLCTNRVSVISTLAESWPSSPVRPSRSLLHGRN